MKNPATNAQLATYKWLADGQKLGVSDANGKGFEYLGSLIYTKNGSSLTLESASFEGGRINKTSNTYEVNYFISDHLGSTRAIVSSEGAVLDRSDYHSYGLKWEHPAAQASGNRWLYNGKELQITGIPATAGILDFGWRMSDLRIIRWKNIDKLSENYYPISPYVFCLNNPIKYFDPDGRIVKINF